MKIGDIVATGHIKRWSVIRTHRQQTLAEHMYLVAAMADRIGKVLFNNWTPEARGKCFGTALTHDFFEIESGDWPTPFKEKNISLHAGLKLAEQSFWDKRSGCPPVKNDVYHDIVKLADLLEAVLFLEVEAVDARAHLVKAKCEDKLWAFLRTVQMKRASLNWAGAELLVSEAIAEIKSGHYGNERIES